MATSTSTQTGAPSNGGDGAAGLAEAATLEGGAVLLVREEGQAHVRQHARHRRRVALPEGEEALLAPDPRSELQPARGDGGAADLVQDLDALDRRDRRSAHHSSDPTRHEVLLRIAGAAHATARG